MYHLFAHLYIIKQCLQKAAGKISFMADLWFNKVRRAYICITAHWLARDKHTNALELKAGLITFHPVPGKHNGKNITTLILTLLDRAGVTAKVSHWTLDN